MFRAVSTRSVPTSNAGVAYCARRWRVDAQLHARVNAQTELNSSAIVLPAFFCFLVGLMFFGDLDPEVEKSYNSMPVRAANPTPLNDTPRIEEDEEKPAHIDRTTGYLVPPTSLVPPQTNQDRYA